MNGFSDEDVAYDKDSTSGRDSYNVGGSGEESDSESGRESKVKIKGEKLFVDKSSDEESDIFYDNNNDDLKKQKRRFASLNENTLHFHVTNGLSDGTRFYCIIQ